MAEGKNCGQSWKQSWGQNLRLVTEKPKQPIQGWRHWAGTMLNLATEKPIQAINGLGRGAGAKAGCKAHRNNS